MPAEDLPATGLVERSLAIEGWAAYVTTPSRNRETGPPADTAGSRPSFVAGERRRVALYLVVGLWNTAFAYGIWALLQYLLGAQLHYLLILLMAWPIAVLNAYLCYRWLVFHSTDDWWRELPRFMLVYVATLVGALVALPILLNTLPFNIYVIQAGYTLAVVIVSYLAHRFFSFRDPPRSAHTPIEEGDEHAGI